MSTNEAKGVGCMFRRVEEVGRNIRRMSVQEIAPACLEMLHLSLVGMIPKNALSFVDILVPQSCDQSRNYIRSDKNIPFSASKTDQA
jgi:hypothetical protein